MDSERTSPAAGKTLTDDPAAKLRHLPEAAQAAFRRFQREGDAAVLDPLIFAILESYIPRKRPLPLAEHAGDQRLVEDLGFDSLAITEVVFFTEDLLEISIANEEIIHVRTLDDLRRFIRSKAAAKRRA